MKKRIPILNGFSDEEIIGYMNPSFEVVFKHPMTKEQIGKIFPMAAYIAYYSETDQNRINKIQIAEFAGGVPE